MERSIIKFGEAGTGNASEIGSKNAALEDLYAIPATKGLHVPDGFAVTVAVFTKFMQHNGLQESLRQLMERLERKDFSNLNETGTAARRLIMEAKFPRIQEQEITDAYAALLPLKNGDVAVRSSPFATGFSNLFPEGLHESYLNIRGPLALIYAIKCCYASLYSNKAIKFRETHGIAHDAVYLAIGIQRMVRAGTGCSGICNTPHSGSGFPDGVRITANWGLGQNTLPETWDEYIIRRPLQNMAGNIQKSTGSKSRMTVYKDVSAGTNSTLTIITLPELRVKTVLDDAEIFELARLALLLEVHYGRPVGFEWAKDGDDDLFYITGLCPEDPRSYRHTEVMHPKPQKGYDVA
ncbi:hypothetical protein OGH69_11865 [Flavobacterium sp. MFBS3-15]|uniref:PEP/pyruvate-binding domain-containing protein n=1 Tax=Flavobacterium sp. MFBS3-15 TaxID=2989816 RepID=UPI0022358B0F|nr:PEP/pyruvate-binding domain-containing protein [Flavobacterium sp. MFBS3-15]MCW4469667.1 hypothetical protein [Flavobacterium sp. MFBS3-15]